MSDSFGKRESSLAPDTSSRFHLAVALDGAGWHPAGWRASGARPAALFTARYWLDLIAEAERGRLDFVTIEDALRLQSASPTEPDWRTDQVRGRLDAVLTAARAAPLTQRVGLVPTVVATHTEPFHIAKAIATLDYASTGRAGVQVQVSARPDEAAHFGRRTLSAVRLDEPAAPETRQLLTDLFDEAADHIEVLRRLWDSWEDDAEIRDVATGRFIDRDKLHYIDFEGRWFRVRGPSITPRPPQGQPLVTVTARESVSYRLVAGNADIGYVAPRDVAQARAIVEQIRAEEAAAGRPGEPALVFADIDVFLDHSTAAAAARKAHLDGLAGAEYASDALVFVGTPTDLADLLQQWQRAGLAGFRLRPGAVPHDLERITRDLVPELQQRGLFRTQYHAETLRGYLGLPRPANRYAAV